MKYPKIVLQGSLLCIGCRDGIIYIYDINTKKKTKIGLDYSQEVVDIKWNLGEDNIIVAYKNSTLRMFTLNEKQPKFIF